jgi:hypothetical protein
MRRGSAVSYKVFVRNWWRIETVFVQGGCPSTGGAPSHRFVPDPGARKTTIATHCTEEEARAICEEYAATHEPGLLSRKAEYTTED